MAKRPALKAPAPIGEILRKILKPRDLQQLELETRLRQAWEAAVSDTIRRHTRLVDYRRRVLFVEAASHAWVQELHYDKPRILAAMQAQLGAKSLQDIRFQPRGEDEGAEAAEEE